MLWRATLSARRTVVVAVIISWYLVLESSRGESSGEQTTRSCQARLPGSAPERQGRGKAIGEVSAAGLDSRKG